MRESKEIFINGNTLEKILEDHKHWLNRDIAGWGNMYANLSGADLSNVYLSDAILNYANLSGADLSNVYLSDAILNYANLRGADLKGANLSGADLSYADLRDVDLRGANLSGADLSYADLRGVDLRYADLRGVDLRGANLNSADLSGAHLRGANLSGANLRYANLRCAYLRGANLNSADLKGADLSDADLNKEEQIRKGVKLSNPITGWKKCKDGVIVKLEIPRGAIVFSINNNKCRTDKAIVKEIFGADRAFSMHKYFSYYVGDKIEVYNFNCEYNTECAEGIHFFRTRNEAENYNY